MAQEAFLVNPMYNAWRGQRKRHRTAALKGWRGRRKKKRVRNPLPSRLLSRMVKKHGRGGMAKAWSAYRRGVRANEPEFNPFGEEVILVGNPRRIKRRRRARRSNPVRRRRVSRRRVAAPRRRRNPWYGQPRRHRKAALSGWKRRRKHIRAYAKPAGAHYPIWRNFMENEPARRYRRYRGYRRNPVAAISITDPMTLVPTLAVGGLSAALTISAPGLVARFVPTMAGGPIVNWGSRLAVAVGGGWAVGKFVGREYGTIWTVVGVATIGGMLVADYILKPMGLLGAYPLGDEYEYLSQGEELLPTREEEGVPLGDVGVYPEESII